MARNPDTGRNAAIGCFVLPLGIFSGAMVGVLVSKIVAWATKAPSCPDIPSCDWYVYAGVGALLGGLSLPFLVLRRLLGRTPAEIVADAAADARPTEPVDPTTEL